MKIIGVKKAGKKRKNRGVNITKLGPIYFLKQVIPTIFNQAPQGALSHHSCLVSYHSFFPSCIFWFSQFHEQAWEGGGGGGFMRWWWRVIEKEGKEEWWRGGDRRRQSIGPRISTLRKNQRFCGNSSCNSIGPYTLFPLASSSYSKSSRKTERERERWRGEMRRRKTHSSLFTHSLDLTLTHPSSFNFQSQKLHLRQRETIHQF